jgi:Polyketide cyclase / dehydrase and lipid transport
MKVLKYAGMALGAVIALVTIIVVMQSPQKHMERSIVINAEPAAIYPYVNNFHKASEWSPWKKIDPNMQQNFGGPEEGVGAKMSWTSENGQVGEGEQWITESEPNKRVKSGVKFGDMEGEYFGELVLEPVEGGTKVTWHYMGDVSNASATGAAFGKFFSMFMDSMLGPQYEQGLSDLKILVENQPAPPLMEAVPADSTAAKQ